MPAKKSRPLMKGRLRCEIKISPPRRIFNLKMLLMHKLKQHFRFQNGILIIFVFKTRR